MVREVIRRLGRRDSEPATSDQDVEPGKIRFRVLKIQSAPPTQDFVDRLRAIGADIEAVEFAQREVDAHRERPADAPA